QSPQRAAHGQSLLDAPRREQPHRPAAEAGGGGAVVFPEAGGSSASAPQCHRAAEPQRLAGAVGHRGRRGGRAARPLGLSGLAKDKLPPGLKLRQLAAARLRDVFSGSSFAPFTAPEIADSRDRALANRLVTTALRRHGHLRLVVARLLDKGLPRKSGSFEAILHLSLAQLLYLRSEEHTSELQSREN